MARPLFVDNVIEYSTTTGTGTLNLGGVPTGVRGQTFVAGAGTGNRVFYSIRHLHADEWETGIGTVTSGAPDTLARNGVFQSSNGDALVSLTAGTKLVFVAPIADGIDSRWMTIPADFYTATPATTSTVTMSDTSDLEVGLPVRYTYGGTAYYGVVTAVTANTLLTIAGATLDTGTAITKLEVGRPELVVQIPFFVSGAYGDGVADLLLADMNASSRWKLADGYVVAYEAAHATVDTGSPQPSINVKVAGNLVGTENTNNGLVMSGTINTWVKSSAIAISTANYGISLDDAIEVRCTVAGGNADASDLSGNIIVVLR